MSHRKASVASSVNIYQPTYDIDETIHRKKICIIGDTRTGKTSIIRRFIDGSFPAEHSPTYFENSKKRKTVVNEKIDLGIFDAGGGSNLKSIRPLNYASVDLFVIIFAIDDPSSLENVTKTWMPEITEFDETPIVLVGNKEDERSEENKSECVTVNQANKVKKQINALSYFECSAKKNTNIEEVFENIVQVLVEQNTWYVD